MYRKLRFYVFSLIILEISFNPQLSAQGKSHDVMHDPLLADGIKLEEWDDAEPGGADFLSLSPVTLAFGLAALGEAHARVVTVTNAANTTVHLTSVAGTTTDFHASFFDSKTLVPGGNTSFSVVFVGRHEGPVSAHLYIHTSLGVHKYPVSATGVCGGWGLWPLTSLDVPAGARVRVPLTLTNPTGDPAQVESIYTSAPWLSLESPSSGAEWGPVRAGPAGPLAWVVARAGRGWVRVRLRAPAPALLLRVETRGAPAGVYVTPPHVRLGRRVCGEDPVTVQIHAGNSAPVPLPAPASLEAAWCGALVTAPAPGSVRHNGVDVTVPDDGIGVTVRNYGSVVPANTSSVLVGSVTFDLSRLCSYDAATTMATDTSSGALCHGRVRFGDASLPYSVTLHRGRLTMDSLHFIYKSSQECLGEQWMELHNELSIPLHVLSVELDDDMEQYYHIWSRAGAIVPPGGRARVLRVRPRTCGDVTLRHTVRVIGDVGGASADVLRYRGDVRLTGLSVGVIPRTGADVWVHNPAPVRQCVRVYVVPRVVRVRPRVCVPARGAARLRVRSRRTGPLWGRVWVRGVRGVVSGELRGVVAAGRLGARVVRLQCAPFVPCSGELIVDNGLSIPMKLLEVTSSDPLITHSMGPNRDIAARGSSNLGRVLRAADWAGGGEELSPRRWSDNSLASLTADERRATRRAERAGDVTVTRLTLRTDAVRAVSVVVEIRTYCPRMSPQRVSLTSAVGSAARISVRIHNPATRAVLVRGVLLNGETTEDADRIGDADQTNGAPTRKVSAGWAAKPGSLMLPAGATKSVTVMYAPLQSGQHYATLYLRNNLTLMEVVRLEGHTSPAHVVVVGGSVTVRQCGPVRVVVTVHNRAAPLRLWPAVCGARGWRLVTCAPRTLPAGAARTLRLRYTPDWTLARVAATLVLRSERGPVLLRLHARLPSSLLTRCGPPTSQHAHPARLGAAISAVLFAIGLLCLAAQDAERLLARALRPPVPKHTHALDLRALAREPPVVTPPRPPPPPPPPRRKKARKTERVAETFSTTDVFNSWTPPPPPSPAQNDESSESETPVTSIDPLNNDGDDELAEEDSSSSSSPATRPEEDRVSLGAESSSSSGAPVRPSSARGRRGGSARRSEERPRPRPAPRRLPARRRERASTVKAAVAAAIVAHENDNNSCGSGGSCGSGAGADAGHTQTVPPPRPRTFSEVVAPRALPPIGSDGPRRRRVEERDHSLFYYGGIRAGATVADWGTSAHDWGQDRTETVATPPPATTTNPPSWPAGWPVRPPPGFPTPAAPVRAFDPFTALSSIWAEDRPAWAADDSKPAWVADDSSPAWTADEPSPAWAAEDPSPAWAADASSPAWTAEDTSPAWNAEGASPAWTAEEPSPAWAAEAPNPAWAADDTSPVWPARPWPDQQQWPNSTNSQ